EKISPDVSQIDRTTVIERGADTNWRMVEPAQGALDLDAVKDLLDDLSQLRAGEFIREGLDNLTEYGLDKPELKITATADGKAYTLQLGRAHGSGDRYASWSDPALVFTVAGDNLSKFQKNLVTTPVPAVSNRPLATVTATNPPPPSPVVPATVSNP
ncbi:MAG: DUF4340 domain-containing protein, partial [Verrucomicrobiia bacterium]